MYFINLSVAHAPRNVNRRIPTLKDLESEVKAAVPTSEVRHCTTRYCAALVIAIVSLLDLLCTIGGIEPVCAAYHSGAFGHGEGGGLRVDLRVAAAGELLYCIAPLAYCCHPATSLLVSAHLYCCMYIGNYGRAVQHTQDCDQRDQPCCSALCEWGEDCSGTQH